MSEPPIPNHICEGDCQEVMGRWPDVRIDYPIADLPHPALSALRQENGILAGVGTLLRTWLRETSL